MTPRGISAKAAEDALIRLALREDIGPGDITTAATGVGARRARARILFRERGVVAGLDTVERVFALVDPAIAMKRAVDDGAEGGPGCLIATVTGPAAGILAAERTALNFLQRLSGAATLTRRFARAVEGTGAAILDTRKTTPGMRALEKKAVVAGGGRNHRMGLYDEILIKDNHIAVAGGVGKAIRRARAAAPGRRIEIEAATLDEAREAADAGADVIMLDNMSAAQVKKALKIIAGRAKTEVSGGVTLENVRRFAELGVDFISIGALTHSAPALDIAMDVVTGRP